MGFHDFRRTIFALVILVIGLSLSWPVQAQDQAERERQLTQRVEQLFKLFVSGEWGKVEPFLTEDSKDLWLALPKRAIDSLQLNEVKVAPDGTEAAVTLTITFRIPQFPTAPFTQPQYSKWLYREGEWFFKLQPPPSPLEIFKMGAAQSDPRPAPSPLLFDPNPIRLPNTGSGSQTVGKVSFQNVTPDAVTIQDLRAACPCLKAEVDKTVIAPQQKGVLTVTYAPSLNTAPQRPLAVQATLAPSQFVLDLPVVIGDK